MGYGRRKGGLKPAPKRLFAGMSLGPNKVEPGDRGVAGMMMAFSLALGIAVGIWSSFALSYFYTGKDPFCFSA